MSKKADSGKGKRPVTVEAMKLRLAGLCARSEQCEADLRMKMRRAGIGQEDADAIISFLREGKFIDDARYARAFVSDKINFAGWGPAKIRAALAAKHLPQQAVAEALAEAESDVLEQSLMRAARSKARSLDLSSRADMAKLLRHLMSRGFSYSDCVRAAARVKREELEEDDEE